MRTRPPSTQGQRQHAVPMAAVAALPGSGGGGCIGLIALTFSSPFLCRQSCAAQDNQSAMCQVPADTDNERRLLFQAGRRVLPPVEPTQNV